MNPWGTVNDWNHSVTTLEPSFNQTCSILVWWVQKWIKLSRPECLRLWPNSRQESIMKSMTGGFKSLHISSQGLSATMVTLIFFFYHNTVLLRWVAQPPTHKNLCIKSSLFCAQSFWMDLITATRWYCRNWSTCGKKPYFVDAPVKEFKNWVGFLVLIGPTVKRSFNFKGEEVTQLQQWLTVSSCWLSICTLEIMNALPYGWYQKDPREIRLETMSKYKWSQ